MPSSTHWHPVAPSHALGPGDRLVATRVLGVDLVLWRSATGTVQAWHDRCPHRGVRLSLGRVLGGRLSCAYHGWEFAPDSGRCMAIPALADLARVPGRVQARPYPAVETRQMVWVRLQTAPATALPDAPAADARTAPPATFVRTLALRMAIDAVQDAVRQRGFEADGHAAWRGALAGLAVRLFTQAAETGLTMLHAWVAAAPAPDHLTALHAALRRLRSDVEPAVG
jgi:nitrite reductase/ring-hydroxylating ferredoxin subunit